MGHNLTHVAHLLENLLCLRSCSTVCRWRSQAAVQNNHWESEHTYTLDILVALSSRHCVSRGCSNGSELKWDKRSIALRSCFQDSSYKLCSAQLWAEEKTTDATILQFNSESPGSFISCSCQEIEKELELGEKKVLVDETKEEMTGHGMTWARSVLLYDSMTVWHELRFCKEIHGVAEVPWPWTWVLIVLIAASQWEP